MLREYYRWELELENGTVVQQSADGEKEPFKFHFKNPDFEKIRTFKLIPKDPDSGLREFKLSIPPGASLIYFRRTMANTGNIFPKFQINMVGWQMEIGKEKVKQITFIYPDGKMENHYEEPTLVQQFIDDLPHKDPSEVKGCTGCQPRLERAKPDAK